MLKKYKTDSEETPPVQYFTILSSGNLVVVAYLRFRSKNLRPNLATGLPLSDAFKLSTVTGLFVEFVKYFTVYAYKIVGKKFV